MIQKIQKRIFQGIQTQNRDAKAEMSRVSATAKYLYKDRQEYRAKKEGWSQTIERP